jgi:hypothetical protein
MKKFRNNLMSWLARPFNHVNVVIIAFFACLVFLGGLAIGFHPYITEVLYFLHAPKLALLIRVFSVVFFSFYCTIGCFCRILIHFFPEDFAEGTHHI